MQSHLELLRSTSGRYAVRELLLKSGRIATDLKLALDGAKDDEESISLQLLVRKWVEIPLFNEFRAFVYHGELTAITQYFDTLYFPELDNFDPAVLRQFYDDCVKPNVQWGPDFVIDFGIALDGQIFVIELNPFLPTTDSCCFNWIRDSNIIGADKGHFEFRKRDAAIYKMGNVVLTPWKKFFVAEKEKSKDEK